MPVVRTCTKAAYSAGVKFVEEVSPSCVEPSLNVKVLLGSKPELFVIVCCEVMLEVNDRPFTFSVAPLSRPILPLAPLPELPTIKEAVLKVGAEIFADVLLKSPLVL